MGTRGLSYEFNFASLFFLKRNEIKDDNWSMTRSVILLIKLLSFWNIWIIHFCFVLKQQ